MSMNQEQLPVVVYWQENQVTITCHYDEQLSTDKESLIASLHLDRLNRLLNMNGFNLKSFSVEDLPRTAQIAGSRSTPTAAPQSRKDEKEGGIFAKDKEHAASVVSTDIHSLLGKHAFVSPGGKGVSVVCSFHIELTADQPTMMGSSAMASSSKQGVTTQGMPTMGSGNYGSDGYGAGDHTVVVVNLINRNLDYLQKHMGVPVVSAMPNWLNAGTIFGCTTHGCPLTPPIPVEGASGRWKTTFTEQLPASLQGKNGAGVTVLVLDTLRPFSDVAAVAASVAGASNTLLQDIVQNVTFNYQDLSDPLDIPNPNQPATGKDIYGRLVGFPVSDHGIFIAGTIRDLAPGAHVECIRVLNDYGVGSTTGLIHTLENIHSRLNQSGDAGSALSLPLVVNLSLVSTPPDEVLSQFAFDLGLIYHLREGLHTAIQSLADQGVMFVAAVGNDSDPRDKSMMGMLPPDSTAPPMRMGPRYPAAFAYDELIPGQATLPGIPALIPVGAVNVTGAAASYSNYPGPVGIATYGGELPTANPADAPPAPPLPPPYGTPTPVVRPIDAVHGVYTSALYPSPSMDDRLAPPSPVAPDYPEYQADPATTWAYWSGTSFATPIITALTAYVLQGGPASTGDSIRQAVLAAATQKPLWTRMAPHPDEAVSGYVIMAAQECVSEG